MMKFLKKIKQDPFSKDVSSWTGLEQSGQDHIGRIYEIRHILNPNRWCCKISLRFCITLSREAQKNLQILKHHEVRITPNFQRIQKTRNIRKSLPQLFLCGTPYVGPFFATRLREIRQRQEYHISCAGVYGIKPTMHFYVWVGERIVQCLRDTCTQIVSELRKLCMH